MNLTSAEWKKLAVPLALLVALLAAGAGLVWWTQREQAMAGRELAAARNERNQARERLTRIAEEEKEVKDKLAVYQRLKALNILGEERRLEWADSMTRIRTSRELLDLRYTVEPKKLLSSVAGSNGGVDFFHSNMKVRIDLLHEGDLITFMRDLRDSGNGYYAPKRCVISRTGTAPTGTSIVPRLRAECEVDLITIIDRAAKT